LAPEVSERFTPCEGRRARALPLSPLPFVPPAIVKSSFQPIATIASAYAPEKGRFLQLAALMTSMLTA
jgi:hypothetical protein